MDGLNFDPPADFVHEEVVSSWRVAAKPQLKDPKLLQPQAQIRPNLTITRVHVEVPDLAGLAATSCDELMRRIDGIHGIKTTEIKFADGVDGLMLEYAFPALQFTVVQIQAMRVDGNTLTTMTMCTEASRLTDDVHEQYLQCLRSASLRA
jgi:hypothetical protein